MKVCLLSDTGPRLARANTQKWYGKPVTVHPTLHVQAVLRSPRIREPDTEADAAHTTSTTQLKQLQKLGRCNGPHGAPLSCPTKALLYDSCCLNPPLCIEDGLVEALKVLHIAHVDTLVYSASTLVIWHSNSTKHDLEDHIMLHQTETLSLMISSW